jgi:phosphoketolase
VDDGNLKFLAIRRKLGRAANYLSVGQIYLYNNQLLKAESGIGQHAFKLVPRNRLQDEPGVMRKFPQRGI